MITDLQKTITQKLSVYCNGFGFSFSPVTTKKVRVVIDQSRACIVLNRMGLFMDNILD